MKKLIPTLALVLVCVGLIWYASSNDFFRETEKTPVKLMDVAEANAQSIAIVSTPEAGASGETGTDGKAADASAKPAGEPVTTEIVREGDGWKMTKPDAYPLNANALESWFGYVSGITQDMVVEENATDLNKYGLGKPKTEFRVTLKDGSTQSMRIGDALPVDGYFYAAVGDNNTVYRVGESSVNAAFKTPLEFIDKNPILFDTDAVTALKMQWKGQSWTLTKSEKDKSAYESKWKLGDKELAGSDASQITGAARFLASDVLPKPASDAGLDGGAADLTVEVTVAQDGADVAKTYSGKLAGDAVWIAAPGEKWAFAIPQQSVQDLFDKGKPNK